MMDGYSTNSQERREAEADAEWRSRVKRHELCFLDYFYSLNAENHSYADIQYMSEKMTECMPTRVTASLIRAALRDPAMREAFAEYIEAAAYAYATSAAE